MTKKKVFIILLSFIFMLTACRPLDFPDSGNAPPAAQTPTAETDDFIIPLGEETSTESTPAVITPLPASPPPEERPLDDTGPWLYFYQTDHRGQIYEVYTANLDGTGLTPILSPLFPPAGEGSVDPQPRVTDMEISPNGDFLAVQVQYTPLNLGLWLLHLPSGEVRQYLSLIGEEAQFKLLEYYPGGHIPTGLPSPLPVSFLWSPDGRILALSAALDGPTTDLYTYNIETNALNRLTAGPGEALLIGWSPDGAWIVHQALSAKDTYMQTSDGVFALSANGESLIPLYLPTVIGEEIIAGWLSNQIFLSYSLPTGTPASLLRQVDISTGTTTSLLAAIFSDATLVPNTNQVLIDLFGFVNWTPEIVPGLHHYDPDINQFEKILPGGYSLLTWVPELGVFAAAQRVAETDILYFNSDREVLFAIPRSHSTILWPLPSPDGQWLLTPFRDSYKLYDSAANLITISDGLGQVVWLPDASGFIQVNNNNFTIVQYLHANEWAPEILTPKFLLQGTFSIISQ